MIRDLMLRSFHAIDATISGQRPNDLEKLREDLANFIHGTSPYSGDDTDAEQEDGE